LWGRPKLVLANALRSFVDNSAKIGSCLLAEMTVPPGYLAGSLFTAVLFHAPGNHRSTASETTQREACEDRVLPE
jgi:hypothetical protein